MVLVSDKYKAPHLRHFDAIPCAAQVPAMTSVWLASTIVGSEQISELLLQSSLHIDLEAIRWEKSRCASKVTARLASETLVAQAAWCDTIPTSFHSKNAFIHVCSDG